MVEPELLAGADHVQLRTMVALGIPTVPPVCVAAVYKLLGGLTGHGPRLGLLS